MKKFILNSLFLIIPFFVYLIVIMIINPYNYNNYYFFEIKDKEHIANSVEPHLFKIISFENNPTKNILLGDSRTDDLASQIKSPGWSNLSYFGGSLKEMIQTFWWAKDIVQIDTVLVGVNLNLYNKYNKRFWVEEALELKKNYFSYAFNKYTFRTTVLVIKSLFTKERIDLHTPNSNKEEFWNYQINETATKFYLQFDYPEQYFKDLNEISTYCNNHGIKLIFWIPPTHVEFQNRKKDFGLEELDKRFISDLLSLGELYDFDYHSEITQNKDDYRDPMHFKEHIGHIVYKDIFLGTNSFSRCYKKDLAYLYK